MIIFKKGAAHELTEGLNTRELDCKCTYDHCRRTLVHEDLVQRFEVLRERIGVPLVITSGFRCSEHNYFFVMKVSYFCEITPVTHN